MQRYGSCAIPAPDLVTLDDWGYPILDVKHPIPTNRLGQARRAVSGCPMLALSLEKVRDLSPGRR